MSGEGIFPTTEHEGIDESVFKYMFLTPLLPKPNRHGIQKGNRFVIPFDA